MKWNPISQSEIGDSPVHDKQYEPNWTPETINTPDFLNQHSVGDVVAIPNGDGGYYYFRKDRVWKEISYGEGERKENLTYYPTTEEMPDAPTADNQFVAVGGVYWYVENGKWVADVPDIPSSWESPVLTMGTNESRTISQVMSGFGISVNDVQTINNFGYTYNKATGTLTITSDTVDYNAIKQQLKDAGFNVDKIVLGNYVTIECDDENGDVVVFDSHNESDVIGSNISGNNKLSAAEKQALLYAVRLKLKSQISDSDWSGLDNGAGQGTNDQTTVLTELDLSEAKISDADDFGGGVKLTKKFKHVSKLTLPTDSNYDKIPEDFAKGSNIEDVDFPSNITSIGKEAFKDCDHLQSVEIDANVTSIGDGAFMSCDALTSVEFARGITHLDFGSSVFEECKVLKTAILPEGLENIGVNMFRNCHMLESVRLPNSLTSIPQGSFENCVSLPLIVIPENVAWIGESAFRNSGVRDLYLTQNDPTQLPLIRPIISENVDYSSFGKYALNANTSLVSREQGAEMANMTHDQADDYFRSVVVGNNSIIEIHYPAADQYVTVGDKQIDLMDYFLKGNPWYHNEGLLNAINNNDKNAAEQILGVQIQGEFGSDDKWKAIAQRIYDEPLFTDCYVYPDKDGHRWPSHNAKENEMRYIMGLVEKSINDGKYDVVREGDYTNLAWRQFVYMDSYTPHEEIYSKDFDDTWYTICFPFNCTEEQLKSAFNAEFNICEFSGVAVEEGEEKDGVITDRLFFLFTNIADTYYMDKSGAYYDCVTVVGQEQINGNNVTVQQKWYHPAKVVKDQYGHDQLVLVNQGEAEWPTWLQHTTTYNGQGGWFNKQTATSTDEKIKYNEIGGILARAYHPYMLHPKNVEGPSFRRKYSTCYIPRVEYKKNFYKSNGSVDPDVLEEVKAEYEANTVTCKMSTVKRSAADSDVIELEDRTIYLQPIEDGKYQYTFIGTPVPNEKNASGAVTSGERIPNGSYFLGIKGNTIDLSMTDEEIQAAYNQLKPEQKFPKFYRRDTSKNNGGGYWMQYTAIIQPNEAAAAWENGHDEIRYEGNANGFSFMLGEYEEVTPDAIEEIINEAKAENKPVKHIDMVININGQVVREGTSLVGLPKGIYIVNGKKYLVR